MFIMLALELPMHTDIYTKAVLTVIALGLLTMACNSVVHPSTVAAERTLSTTQFIATNDGFLAIDTRTGNIWRYAAKPGPSVYVGKIAELGDPLQ
jgi:hypothetical protein